MKKLFINLNSVSILITTLIILTFTISLLAQNSGRDSVSSFAEDTSINPHDFNHEYYAANGVYIKAIIEGRTGTDFLSVFSKTSNPIHRGVRVLVTLPAYNQDGEMLFWYPLGELNGEGFTQDVAGVEARQIADFHPVYIFPSRSVVNNFAFTNNRQAAIIDNSQNYLFEKGNPLGLRVIISVRFTEKAFSTKEGIQMMDYMAKKNSLSLDGTPLIKTAADLLELTKHDLISMEKRSLWEDPTKSGIYAISPVIENPVKGVIAPDAFLLTVMQDGKPLPGEMSFFEEFNCLQKTGDWCGKK